LASWLVYLSLLVIVVGVLLVLEWFRGARPRALYGETVATMLLTAAGCATVPLLAQGSATFWIAAVIAPGLLVLVWLARPRPKPRMIETVATVLLTATVSPFVMAFAAKLGERLGTDVEIKRLPWRRQRQGREELVVAPPCARGRTITLEVDSELSEDARLALIELDVSRPELWGHRLRWDKDANAWLPVPPGPDNEASG
jgi:hypothetical protein